MKNSSTLSSLILIRTLLLAQAVIALGVTGVAGVTRPICVALDG